MKFFVFILLASLILSCTHTPKMEYKYKEKEPAINCSNQNNALLNEALYSFEEDLLQHNPKDGKTLIAAYGQYLYQGMAGKAPYKDIANPHSLAIRDALIAEGIITLSGAKSNLKYNHPAVQCIINNVEDADLKRTLNALVQTNSVNPSQLSGRLRNFGRNAAKNRNQAAYVALESYYQNLVGLSLDPALTHE